MSKGYSSWSKADLKTELQKRNEKVVGKKAELVQRLEDYDNLYGLLETDPDSVYEITVPAPEDFQDVTSNSAMPELSSEDLEVFCHLTKRDDINTSRNMYEEYFLKSCQIALADCEYYVTGLVVSEQHINVSYLATIKMKNHMILEAQCECSAGMGPYAQCKHILVILFGIIDMTENKNIKLKSLKTSNTSRLQTVHQPKQLYTGDPIKAEDLALKFNDEKYRKMTMFDPRPTVKSAEIFSNNFIKTISNFCDQNQIEATSMPIAQLIKPAEQPSIYMEQDYFKQLQEETSLEGLRLTEDQRYKLEKRILNKKFLNK